MPTRKTVTSRTNIGPFAIGTWTVLAHGVTREAFLWLSRHPGHIPDHTGPFLGICPFPISPKFIDSSPLSLISFDVKSNLLR